MSLKLNKSVNEKLLIWPWMLVVSVFILFFTKCKKALAIWNINTGLSDLLLKMQ